MGAIFGPTVVASMPTVAAAVFVAGEIPSGWVNDTDLGPALTDAVSRLGHTHVLLNKEDDELFPGDEVRRLFKAVVAASKQLTLWPGPHDTWDTDTIDASVAFLTRHAGRVSSEPELGRPTDGHNTHADTSTGPS